MSIILRKPLKCIHFGLENPRQSKLCRKCGAFLGVPLKCPQCGSNNPGDSIFCIVCGARLSRIHPEELVEG
jgi:hypothetical protein